MALDTKNLEGDRGVVKASEADVALKYTVAWPAWYVSGSAVAVVSCNNMEKTYFAF
jgi:hypothetical protein